MHITMRRWLTAALAIAALLAVAADAVAQVSNLYYKEFRKDGRIYVFNDPGAAGRFEKSGETGTGLTRLGVGPDGETVFADNETALELFFFKYNISEPVPRATPPTQRIEWRDGKTRITAGSNFYLEMSNRIQVRYTHEDPTKPCSSQAPRRRETTRGRSASGGPSSSSRVVLQALDDVRGTDQLAGHLERESRQYLEDAALSVDFTKGKKRFMVKAGQFKVPFGLQELISSGSQQFVDRSLVSNAYFRVATPACRCGGCSETTRWSIASAPSTATA